MEPLQQTINYFFFIIIYVPFNVGLMIITTILFRLANRVFQLNFPVWVLGLAAAIFVFVVMYAYLDSLAHKGGWVNLHNDNEWLLNATLIINFIILAIMFGLMLFGKLIFKSDLSIAFVFQKPQIIASGIYLALMIVIGVQPLLNAGKDYVEDLKSDNYNKKIKEMIAKNDTAAFRKELQSSVFLKDFDFKDDERGFMEYLIDENKTELTDMALKADKQQLDYSLKWNIKTPEMMNVLAKNGMNPNVIVKLLTNHNQRELIPVAVQKYHPDFKSDVDLITMNVVKLNDAGMMDYLIANGLTNDLNQTNETINYFAKKNEFETIKMLMERGFKLDTNDSRLIYSAIYNRNLPLLKYFFQYPFDIDKHTDEYTHLENAIIGGDEDIFDYLMTHKPDLTTIHTTQLNGNTNALLIAEKYKQFDMLKKLKAT